MGVVADLKRCRDARRWQRWTEEDPLDELVRRGRVGGTIAFAFFALVVALVVVGLVIAR